MVAGEQGMHSSRALCREPLHGAADGKPAAGEPKRVATDSNLKNRALRFMRPDPCTTG